MFPQVSNCTNFSHKVHGGDCTVAWDHALSLLSLYVSHGKRALFFFPSRAKEAKKKKKMTPDLRLIVLLISYCLNWKVLIMNQLNWKVSLPFLSFASIPWSSPPEQWLRSNTSNESSWLSVEMIKTLSVITCDQAYFNIWDANKDAIKINKYEEFKMDFEKF